MCDRQTDVTAALRERQSELDSAERTIRKGEERKFGLRRRPPIDDSISVVTEQSEQEHRHPSVHTIHRVGSEKVVCSVSSMKMSKMFMSPILSRKSLHSAAAAAASSPRMGGRRRSSRNEDELGLIATRCGKGFCGTGCVKTCATSLTRNSRNHVQNSLLHLPSTQSDRRRAELHRERQRRLLVVLRLRSLLLFPGARGRLRPTQAQVQTDAQQSEPQSNNPFFDLNILMRVSNCPPPPPQVDCGRRGPSKASSPHCTRSKALSRSLMLWAPTRAFLLPSLITRWAGWKPFLPIWQHAVGTRRLKARCKAAPYSALRKMK